MQGADFWNDQEDAKKVSQQAAQLKEDLEIVELLKRELKDIQELSGLSDDAAALEPHIQALAKNLQKEEFKIFLSGKYDKKNALLEIFAGAGGQDSQDWATMLLRMYERYCAKKGFKMAVLHQSFGDGGGPDGRIGTKSVTL